MKAIWINTQDSHLCNNQSHIRPVRAVSIAFSSAGKIQNIKLLNKFEKSDVEAKNPRPIFEKARFRVIFKADRLRGSLPYVEASTFVSDTLQRGSARVAAESSSGPPHALV